MVAESYNRVSAQVAESSEAMMERCQAAAQEYLEEYPLALTLGAFAVGIGLGAAIGASLARPLGLQQHHVAENLGRRILDSISEYVPSSVQRHLHS